MSDPAPDVPMPSGEGLFREIFELQIEAQLLIDASGNVLAANPAAQALLRQGQEVLRAQAAWCVLPGFDPAQLAARASALAPGEAVELTPLDSPSAPAGRRIRASLRRLASVARYWLLQLGEEGPAGAPAPGTGIRGAAGDEAGNYFRELVQSIPVQLWSARGDGSTEFQNARWLEYSGLTPTSASDWGWQDALHPDDAEAYARKWFEIMASGRPGEAEARFRRHDGAYRWFMMRATPVVDAHGDVVRWCGANTDIEDRKAAELALRRSQAYLAQAQTLSRTGSFGWEPASDTVFWSKETYCILGFERRVIPSLERTLERVDPDDLPLVAASIAAARDGAARIDIAYRLRMPGGEIKYVHMLAEAGEDRSTYVGAIMDLTERAHAEQAQRRSQARFQGIVDIAEDAIVSFDTTRRIVLFNQGAEKIFGYAAAEVLGRPLELLLPPTPAEAHRAAFADDGAAGATRRRLEILARRKDHSVFPAEVSISRLDLDGERMVTAILRDITERHRLMESMLASERFARSQAEALASALGVLARELKPERVIEHGLRTLVEQLHANSCSLWLKGEDDMMSYAYALEFGVFKTRADPTTATLISPLPIDAVPPWPEIFRTRNAVLLEDIAHGPDFPWRHHVLAQGIVSVLVVPMLMADAVAGVIGIRFDQTPTCSPEELALAQALANHCMVAIELSRLMAKARLSSAVMERNRIARDLHDTIAQGLTGVIVQLEAAADANAQGLPEEAADHARRAGALARESLREARRSVRALRPHSLEGRELCEALRHMMEQMTAGTGVEVTLSLVGTPPAMEPEWEQNVLRIAQEAVTNAMRHAMPRHIAVTLTFARDSFELLLLDDGVGFVPGHRSEGQGLLGIAERAAEMGGKAQIESVVGQGTSVYVYLPIHGHS